MKKIISISAMSLLALFMTTSVYADNGTAGSGIAVQIVDGVGVSGATLDFDQSPGVTIEWGTSSNSYAITAMNVNSSSADQNEYGVYSNYSGYYQHPTAVEDVFGVAVTGLTNVDTTTDIADPFAAWTAMGGAGGAAAAAADG